MVSQVEKDLRDEAALSVGYGVEKECGYEIDTCEQLCKMRPFSIRYSMLRRLTTLEVIRRYCKSSLHRCPRVKISATAHEKDVFSRLKGCVCSLVTET